MNETKKDNMSQEQNHYPQSNGATSENQPMTALPQSQQSSDSSQIHDDTQPQISSENKPQPSDTSSFFKGLFIVKFTGRMRRRDFLLSLLLLLISEFLIGVVIGLAELLLSFVYEMGFDEGRDEVILSFFGSYLTLVMLGMAVRRLHDAGKSGWILLLCFLPLVGIFVGVGLLVIMCCRNSQREPNRWGPNPKGVLCDEGSRSEDHTVNERDIATQERKKCEQPSGVSGVRKCINVIGGFMIMVAMMLLMHKDDMRGFIADVNSCFGIDDDAVEAHQLMWQVEQGLKYYEGFRGARQDRVAAEKLICEAFDKGVEEQTRQWGDACAKGLLGVCYDMGIGVEQDGAKATYWYDQARAADIFFYPRQYPLGVLDTRDNGIGVGAKEKAARWYRMAQRGKRKAAKEGNVYAMYELGECYLEGIGVERDEDQAKQWLQKAAETGYTPAKELLQILEQK